MSREHNNTMQKLILNYTRLHEHTHLRKYAYLYEDMRYAHEEVDECAVTSERHVFVILIIKSRTVMSCPHCVDSVGIRISWLRSS